jgi:hypothetical protein
VSLSAESVRALLDPGFVAACCRFADAQQPLQLEEPARDGRGFARITVRIRRKTKRRGGGFPLLQLTLEQSGGKQWFPLLKQQQCADFALLVEWQKDAVSATVIECKETVSATEWDKVREQLAGDDRPTARADRGLAAAAARSVTCYTAFRRDMLTAQLDASPARRRPRVGKRAEKGLHRDWLRPQVELPSLGSFPHRKLQLDEHGIGSLQLTL